MSARADNIALAIQYITQTIRIASEQVASEESNPVFGADESDDRIKSGRKLVTRLREIRRELEDLTFTEYLL